MQLLLDGRKIDHAECTDLGDLVRILDAGPAARGGLNLPNPGRTAQNILDNGCQGGAHRLTLVAQTLLRDLCVFSSHSVVRDAPFGARAVIRPTAQALDAADPLAAGADTSRHAGPSIRPR